MILATFSSCCCYEFWLPFPRAAAEAFAGPRMGKRHGRPLFPLAAAMNFGYLVLLLLQKLLLLLLLVPGWENTMAVKDGEAPKLHPENA